METGENSESSGSNAGSSEQSDNNPQVLVQESTGNEGNNEETAAPSVPRRRGRGRAPRNLPPEVPQQIRDRIKALLDLKYLEGGCALLVLADQYEDFYGEELNPRNYGFEDMKSMLNAFPKEELIMKKVAGDPRVYGGVPLKKTDRIEALRRIFDPAGQPHIPWRKDEQVIPQSDDALWTVEFLQDIFQGANTSSLDSNQTSLSVTNNEEVFSVPPKAKEIIGRSISLQTETATETSSGLPDSTKESHQVTLELADADTSNDPRTEQPGTSRSSGVPQPPTEPEPEVSIIENEESEEIVECITIEDSDDEDEEKRNKDSTSVTSKLPLSRVQPMILPKTEARPNAQASNRSQIVFDFVEKLQKKGQSGTASNQNPPNNNLASKCNNQVSAGSSKDTSAQKKSTSSQVNTRSKQSLLSSTVHVHAETVQNDLGRPSAESTRTCKSRATTPKKSNESDKVQKSPPGTPSLAPVVEERPLDLRKAPEDLRKEPEDLEKEPIDLRKEPVDRSKGSQDLRNEPAAPRTEPAAPRTEPAAPRTEPAAPRTEPAAPGKVPAAPRKEPAAPGKVPAAPRKEPAAPRKEPASPRTEPAAPRTEPAAPRTEPAAPGKVPAAPRKEPASPRTEPAAPRTEPAAPRTEPAAPGKVPAAPRKEPAAPRKEPAAPRKGPAAPRKEPAAPRKEPAAPRKAPAAPRKEPAAPRKEPVDPKNGAEDLNKSGPTAVIQAQPPPPEPNSPVAQLPPIRTPEGYKCRITEEEYIRCMSMFVRLKRLEDCENPTTTPRKSTPRKRKISEVSVISSDDDPTIKLDTRRKSQRLASKKPPTVSDLCVMPSRPDQYWFTTNFREDIDGIEASTYKDLMQYTEILRPPDIVESEDYLKKFTKTYYFMYTDQLRSDLKRLEEAAKEWSNEMYQGFYLNPFASLSVEYSVSATETEIIVDPEQSIKIPMMNYEAIQMANLDADANICDIAGRSEQMIVVTSYGNYADYFLWKWGKNCQCVGLLPAKSNGLAKFKRAGGVSYDNFYLHDDGASSVFEPDQLDGFISSMKMLYPSLADLFVANGIGWTGMKQRPQDLALVQCLLALEIVRQRGSFILKLNDTFTCFAAGLLFYLSRCFGYLTMLKPVSSLPGERFVICRDKHSEARCKPVKDYLRTCYNKIVENQWVGENLYLDKIFGTKDGSPTSSRLTEVDNKFLFCLKKWNSGIVKVELDEYDSFCVVRQFWSESSPETRLCWLDNLKIVRSDYLEAWNLTLDQSCEPQPETGACEVSNGPTIFSLLDSLNLVGEKTVGTVDLNTIAGNLPDWKLFLSASPVCRHVFHATDAGTSKWDGSWKHVDGLTLPTGTFLYGEIFSASKSRPAFLSIMDVKQWGREIMDDKPYNERIRLVQEKTKDVSKDCILVTFSDAFNIDDIPMVLNRLNENKKFPKSYFRAFEDNIGSTSTTKNSNTTLNIIVGGLVFVPIKKTSDDCSENSNFSHLVSQRLLWTFSSPSNLREAAETLYTVIRNRGSSSSHAQNTPHLSDFAQFVYGLKNLK